MEEAAVYKCAESRNRIVELSAADTKHAVAFRYDREPEQVWEGTAYYDGPCTVHICVEEEGFCRDEITVDWEAEAEAGNAIERGEANPWTANWWKFQEETGVYEKEYTADRDGRYHCRVGYREENGEIMNYEDMPFVVDQTKPEISVESMGKGDALSEDLLIEVKEENFSEEQTFLFGRRDAGDEEGWREIEASWVRIGESALTQVRVNREEVEELRVVTEDLAGNQAECHMEMGSDGRAACGSKSPETLYAALAVLVCFFLLTVFTGVRKIFL